MSFDPAGIKNACCMDLFVLSRILNTLITPWTIRPKLPSFYAQRQDVAHLKALEPEIHLGRKWILKILGNLGISKSLKRELKNLCHKTVSILFCSSATNFNIFVLLFYLHFFRRNF